ncbi:MAG: hypothetical protein FWF97_01375 [Alphaproteobacteria bacterium]|nr:hypothetical protein [Alphaproteobacteria bacterium]
MKKLLLILPIVLLCACDSYKDKLYNAYYKQCMQEMKNGFYGDLWRAYATTQKEYCKDVAFNSTRELTNEQAKFELKHKDFRPWGRKR